MLGVFAAYFVTIVIFAGLYLTVNKAGVYYGDDGTNGANNLVLESINTAESDLSLEAGAGGDGVDVASFCGMDINNHMEGECLYLYMADLY